MSLPPIVLAFAASDPTGGAGIQADLQTIASLGCHPLSVVTALTAQDTRGVHSLLAVDPAWIEKQASAVLDDIPAGAFKVGVLGSRGNARAVAAILRKHPRVPVVLDPVLASARGDALATDERMEDALQELLPLATVVTPNTLEAERLGGVERILGAGARYVLLTGTHAATPEVANVLVGKEGVVREDRWPRLEASYHGSGCTLASACAAFLAQGRTIPGAVFAAQAYTWRALEAGFRPGAGQHLPSRSARP